MSILTTLEDLENVDEIEKIKLRIEYFKAWGTVISIMVSLLGALTALAINMILSDKKAQADFELKAVEIVMSASSSTEAINKAVVLQEMFSDRLSRNFSETLKKIYGKPD